MSHDAVDGDVTAQKTPSVLFAERANHQVRQSCHVAKLDPTQNLVYKGEFSLKSFAIKWSQYL
jgi:hypothetical protein